MNKANQLKVAVGLAIGLTIAGLPLMNKKVYEREQQVAAMRDSSYDEKDQARASRLSRKTHKDN
jgi:hypothetical protein